MMKKIQLLSVVFSLIMAIALTTGPGIAYAGLDDSIDESREVESIEDESNEDESNEDESNEDESNEDESNEDESGRDGSMKDHDYAMKHDMRTMLDRYCEMSPEDQVVFLEKYPMTSDHQNKPASDHQNQMTEYCLQDEAGRKVLFDEHHATMTDKMSDHKDTMTDKMSDHKDTMTDKMPDHKSHKVMRASSLTDEQKSDIKAMHMELRDLKQSMKEDSTDLDNEEIRNQFMEKAKEFSMAWLSPRHQIAAGIDAQMVECRDGFSLVMKTSNEAPICVKESTAEKLIERGIAISAI